MKAHSGPSKRTSVLFNMDDYGLIMNEVARRTEESGYPVTMSEVLRDLVREKWKGNDETDEPTPDDIGSTDWFYRRMRDREKRVREHQTPGSRETPLDHTRPTGTR